MLNFRVAYFNPAHEAILRASPLGPNLDQIVLDNWQCDEDVFLAYSMFVHQKLGRDGWKTYSDLKRRLPAFREGLLSYFSVEDGSVRANFSGANESRTDQTEAIGVGCALGCLSAALALTDADWEKIDISTAKDLDFRIASDGTKYVAVEARGRIRDSQDIDDLSGTANAISEKKSAQREFTAANAPGSYPHNATLIGIIAAIPHMADTPTTVWLLDPPPVGINDDPKKYQLVSRLNYYHRILGMICGKATFLIALSNHIRGIETAANYTAFDSLPLLNGTRGEITFPRTILDSRTVTHDQKIVGEVIPLGNNRAYFVGIEVRLIRMMMRPNFATIATFRSRRTWRRRPVPLTIRIRKTDSDQFRPVSDVTEAPPETGNRAQIEGKGLLSTTPGGLVLGEVFW